MNPYLKSLCDELISQIDASSETAFGTTNVQLEFKVASEGDFCPYRYSLEIVLLVEPIRATGIDENRIRPDELRIELQNALVETFNDSPVDEVNAVPLELSEIDISWTDDRKRLAFVFDLVVDDIPLVDARHIRNTQEAVEFHKSILQDRNATDDQKANARNQLHQLWQIVDSALNTG